MQQLFSKYSVSFTEVQRSLSKTLEAAGNEPVALIHKSTVKAYIVPVKLFEEMMSKINSTNSNNGSFAKEKQ